jgi:hypothetical protein
MGAYSGPSIINKNLNLYVDSKNYKNFEKGIIENTFPETATGLNFLNMRGDITYSYVGIEDGWFKYSISGTGSSNTYPYSFAIRPMIINADYRVSVSFKYKTNVQNKFLSWGDARMVNIFYKSGFTSKEINYGEYIFSKLENIAPDRTTSDVPLVGNQFQPIYFLSRPKENEVFNPSTDFLYFKDVQVERNTYTGVKWFNLKSDNFLEFINSARLNPQKNAIILDGLNDYINTQSTFNIKSASLVIRFPSLGNYSIIGPHANGEDNWFGITSSGKIDFFATETTDVNNFSVLSNATLTTNTFYFISFTLNGNKVKLYLNGNLDKEETKNFIIAPWNGNLTIGRRGSLQQRYFNGEISYIKLYSSVLSDLDIKKNFNATRGRFGI